MHNILAYIYLTIVVHISEYHDALLDLYRKGPHRLAAAASLYMPIVHVLFFPSTQHTAPP